MNYNSLVSDMQTYMLRTDNPYVDKIPDLIQQGIIRVYNNAKDLGFEISTQINLQPNRATLNKPGNWRETIDFQMVDATNNARFLLPRSYEFCKTYWPYNTTVQVAKPKYYADIPERINENTNGYGAWFIAPSTDAAYRFFIKYLGIPLFDEAHPTNFLTQRYPNLLLYSCLIEACLFLDDEEKRNKYQTMFDQELETINRMNTGRSADRTVIRDNN